MTAEEINRQSFEMHQRMLREEQADALAAFDAEWAAKIEATGDEESQHIAADRVLCELLLSLGFNQTVEAFNKLDKWYA